MSNAPGKYTRYFKEKALEEWARGKRPTWVAREFGIDRSTLYRWFHQWQRMSAPKVSQPHTAGDLLYSQFATDGTITMRTAPAPRTKQDQPLSQVDKSSSAVRITSVWLLPLANC